MSIGVSISTKPWLVHGGADGAVDPGPGAQVALHAVAAQVDVAVPQPDRSRRCRPRSSSGKGGGSAAERTSTSQSPTSTSPVARPAFTVPSGRGRTVPATRTTNSVRRSSAPSTTHWTTPVWSRRSTKARCSPCSRRRATQPHSDTVCRRGRRGARRTGGCASRRRGSLGSVGWSRIASRIVRQRWSTTSVAGDDLLLGVGAGRARWRCRRRASWSPTMTATGAPERPAAFIWDFMDRPSNARSARRPARAQLGGQVAGGRAVGGVDHEHVERSRRARRTRPRRRRPAASARCPSRSRCRAWAGRRAARPGRRSGRRRRRWTGRRRARRSGTRTACACSSRARGPGRGSSSNGMPSAREPGLHPVEVGARRGVEARRRCGGRRRRPPGSRAAWSRGPAAGGVSTFSRSSGARSPAGSAQPGAQGVGVARPGRSAVPIVLSARRQRRRPRAPQVGGAERR